MKKTSVLLFFLILLLGCGQKETRDWLPEPGSTLKIYTYDSFVTWGLAEKTIPFFEERYDCEIFLESVGDAGNIINRLLMEKDNPQADIVIGIDNTLMSRILAEDLLISYKSENLDKIRKELHFDRSYCLTPYDYGYFAFVYDSEVIQQPPSSFGTIQDGIWKNKFVISDPRTSSPGLGLLLWTIAAFGENGYSHFWRSMKSNILTVSSSWDEAYSMLLAGEVPIVLSYSSSPAFHIEIENSYRYRAFIPQEGSFKQIEGAGIIKGTSNLELAQLFIDFILTMDFQKHVPTTQWMYPVNDNVKLPESFEGVVIPENNLNEQLDLTKIRAQTVERWLIRWAEIMIE
jgi:thiamine transport system substrate-binding protein